MSQQAHKLIRKSSEMMGYRGIGLKMNIEEMKSMYKKMSWQEKTKFIKSLKDQTE